MLIKLFLDGIIKNDYLFEELITGRIQDVTSLIEIDSIRINPSYLSLYQTKSLSQVSELKNEVVQATQ